MGPLSDFFWGACFVRVVCFWDLWFPGDVHRGFLPILYWEEEPTKDCLEPA